MLTLAARTKINLNAHLIRLPLRFSEDTGGGNLHTISSLGSEHPNEEQRCLILSVSFSI
jgi:hypothetical protein